MSDKRYEQYLSDYAKEYDNECKIVQKKINNA